MFDPSVKSELAVHVGTFARYYRTQHDLLHRRETLRLGLFCAVCAVALGGIVVGAIWAGFAETAAAIGAGVTGWPKKRLTARQAESLRASYARLESRIERWQPFQGKTVPDAQRLEAMAANAVALEVQAVLDELERQRHHLDPFPDAELEAQCRLDAEQAQLGELAPGRAA